MGCTWRSAVNRRIRREPASSMAGPVAPVPLLTSHAAASGHMSQLSQPKIRQLHLHPSVKWERAHAHRAPGQQCPVTCEC